MATDGFDPAGHEDVEFIVTALPNNLLGLAAGHVNWIDQDAAGLGGFVLATAAGLDSGFDSVFVMLTGGDLYDLKMTGHARRESPPRQACRIHVAGRGIGTIDRIALRDLFACIAGWKTA